MGTSLATMLSQLPRILDQTRSAPLILFLLRYQLGQELYLETALVATSPYLQLFCQPKLGNRCSRLAALWHKATTWLIRHACWYGNTYKILRSQAKEEETPYRVDDSRYFKALHPQVKLPRPVQITSCISCHPSAAQYNFRRLTPEWQSLIKRG